MQYVTLALSIISIIFIILTFFFNRNDGVKKDIKEEKDEEINASYKMGVMNNKLDNLEKQVSKVLDKLESYDKEFDEKIEKAIQKHEQIYHKQ